MPRSPRIFEEIVEQQWQQPVASPCVSPDPWRAGERFNATDVCSAVKSCYCMRHTLFFMNDACGWCQSSNPPRGMLGTPGGPAEGQCAFWIFRSRECPVLHCASDVTPLFVSSLVGPVLTLGLIWILLWTCHSSGCTEAELEPEFTGVKRTVENFRKGLWGQRAQKSKNTFQRMWDTRAATMKSVLGELFASDCVSVAAERACVLGFWMSVFYTVLRILPMVLERESFQIIETMLQQGKGTADSCKMIVGFMFGFYALGRVSWWWNLLDKGRTIQGRTHDIAMLVGAVAAAEEHGDPERWWETKFTCFRYLMLIFFLNFRSISAAFQKVSDDMLLELGFIEPQEAELLRSSMHPRKIVLKWLTLWVHTHVKNEQSKFVMLDRLCDLRGACGALHDTYELRAPWTFEALLYTSVHSLLVLLPFYNLESQATRESIVSTPIVIPTLNCMAVAFFYFTLLGLLEVFKEPYGRHTDCMNVQTIFLESETTVWEFLQGPVPDNVGEDACPEKLYVERKTQIT